jgi:hypothetical protein
MGVNCKIYLSNHAHPKKVYQVVRKYMGHEFEYDSFKDYSSNSKKEKKPINPEQEGSEKNPWHIRFKDDEDNYVIPEDLNYCQLIFKDLAENNYSALISYDYEDDSNMLNGEKLLNPSSEVVWCAIGKCLVDFFGGKMIYSDTNDDKFYVNKKAPQFPKQKAEQTSDERWYQYFNALNKVKPIQKADLDFIDNMGVTSVGQRSKKLMDFLEQYEKIIFLHQKLDKNLEKKTDSTSNSPLRKV